MPMNRRHQQVQDNEDGTVTIGGPCIFTGEFYSVTVPAEQYDRYVRGAYVQDAFPNQPADVREFIISGISPAGWAATFRHGPEFVREDQGEEDAISRTDEDAEYDMDVEAAHHTPDE